GCVGGRRSGITRTGGASARTSPGAARPAPDGPGRDSFTVDGRVRCPLRGVRAPELSERDGVFRFGRSSGAPWERGGLRLSMLPARTAVLPAPDRRTGDAAQRRYPARNGIGSILRNLSRRNGVSIVTPRRRAGVRSG